MNITAFMVKECAIIYIDQKIKGKNYYTIKTIWVNFLIYFENVFTRLLFKFWCSCLILNQEYTIMPSRQQKCLPLTNIIHFTQSTIQHGYQLITQKVVYVLFILPVNPYYRNLILGHLGPKSLFKSSQMFPPRFIYIHLYNPES